MLVRTRLRGHRQGRTRSLDQHFLNAVQYLFYPHGGARAPNLDHFTLNSGNIVYCIVCEQCSLMYVSKTGRLLWGDGNSIYIALRQTD